MRGGEHLVATASDDAQIDQFAGGRVAEFGALLEFVSGEAVDVVFGREDDSRMVGAIGLHDRLARPLGTAATARHLRQESEGPFGGAKIRRVQAHIGRDDADQRHRREIQALGDHLGAHQHVAAFGEFIEQARVVADARRRVAVHAYAVRFREERLHGFGHLLRTDAELADLRRAARRALLG